MAQNTTTLARRPNQSPSTTEADKTTSQKALVLVGKSAKTAGRTWWTHKLRLAPINAGIAALGVACLLPEATPKTMASVLVGGPVLGAIAMIWHRIKRRRSGRELNGAQTTYNLSCATTAWIYEVTAVWVDPLHEPMLIFLGSATALSSVLWWVRGAFAPEDAVIPEPVAQPAPEAPPAKPEPTPEEKWARRLAAPRGQLVGSKLVDVEPIIGSDGKPNGFGAIIDLNPDDGVITITDDQIARALKHIAIALDVDDRSRIAILPTTSTRVPIRVFERHPLARRIELPHEVAANAWRQPIGLSITDDWVMHEMYRSDHGAYHGLVAGSTGSGKSELMCTLLVAQRRVVDEQGRPLVASVLLDPHKGVSYPGWKDAVDLFITGDAYIVQAVRALLEEKDRRLDLMAEQGIKVWTPTWDQPLISTTIDEFGPLAKRRPDIIPLVKEYAGECRKAGMGLTLAVRYPGVDEFGGDMELRDSLVAGFTYLLRTGNAFSGMIVANGRAVGDPALLPDRFGEDNAAGVGYALGSTANSSVMYRGALSDADEPRRGATARSGLTRKAIEEIVDRAEEEREEQRRQAFGPLRVVGSPAPMTTGSSPAPAPATAAAATDASGFAGMSVWDAVKLVLTEYYPERPTTGELEKITGKAGTAITMACTRAKDRGELFGDGYRGWVLAEHATGADRKTS